MEMRSIVPITFHDNGHVLFDKRDAFLLWLSMLAFVRQQTEIKAGN